ncbi:ectoine hydroxylase [Roseivivax marinus]|uniref:Ectoine hydroxylase n=1 Tax=Roseivivax marinus TaxID=1379903 RepID=W4HK62_9RHOB|nr:ectoine hydroxylase [Roseivivax marinus]ETW13127.1 ectoine hydroxylase [Roseivivax marinus]
MPLEFAPQRDVSATQEDAYPTRHPDRETWLERKDPVVWTDKMPPAPLTRSDMDSFERDGFLVMRDLFSPAEVAALVDRSRELREGGRAVAGDDVVTEPDSDAVRTIFRLDEHDGLMNALSRDARIAGIVSHLLADDVYLHQSRLNYKPGFTGKEFYWHSDFETWHAEDGMPRMRAISASLLLTENRAQNGALMLMPGSQNVFVSCQGETPDANHESSLKRQEVGTPSQVSLADLAAQHGITDAEGPAGTLILFDCNTIHGSNGNITPTPRSNAFFVYNAVSNALTEPFAASGARPDFLATRNTPEPIDIRGGALV